jgi:hypothetical protein
MMSGGDFEAKYGVSAVEYHDQLIFQRAVNEGEGFTGSIWDYTTWGSIPEYHFVDGKPTELTTYAYYFDGEEGIIVGVLPPYIRGAEGLYVNLGSSVVWEGSARNIRCGGQTRK